MRTKRGALVVRVGAALAAAPTGPAAADPVPIRVATISAAGSGDCWEGSAEGRLTWPPGAIVDTVRVTATVFSAEMTDPRCGLPRATYRAYSGSSTVDSQTLTASEETVSDGFTFTAPFPQSIDRVEVPRVCGSHDVPVS